MKKLLVTIIATGLVLSLGPPVHADRVEPVSTAGGIVKDGRDGREVTKREYRKRLRKEGKRRINKRTRHRYASHQQQVVSFTNAAGDPCTRRSWEVGYEHALTGWDGMRFHFHARWCWSGGRVSQARFWVSVWTAWWVLWGYEGMVESQNWSGPRYRGAYRQGHFRFCYLGWACQHKYPWHEAEVRAGGKVNHRKGG